MKGLKQENGAVAAGADSCPSTTAKGTFRWSGEFVNPAMERGYFQSTWYEKKSRLHALTIGAYVFVIWSIFDFSIMGPSGTFFLLLAGRLAALGSILMALKFFHSVDGRNGFLVCVLLAQFLIATIAPISLMLGQVEFSIALLSIIIILFAFYVGLPVPLSCNAAISILLSLGFVAVIPTMEGRGFADMLQIVTLLMVANAIGIQMVRTTNILRRDGFLTLKRQQKLNNQLKREVEIRQEAERAVQETEESFQSIFYAAPLPLALVDSGRYSVIQANEAALSLFGVGDREAYAQGIDIRQFFAGDDTTERVQHLLNSSLGAEPVEFCLKDRAGNIIWALVSAAKIHFQGKNALLFGIQDVTARRQESEALRDARDQATAASRSKSEFLANMSHELRTPLNAIIGFSEALERELFGPVGNPRYREYAEDIHDSGVHLLSLINDILDLSKIEAGHFTIHEDEIELDHIINAALRIVRIRAQQARIQIDCNLPSPSPIITVDERAMKQVLINLLSNAVKFSPEGSQVSIDAQVRVDYLRVTVVDSGIGIAADDIPRALTPFTQLDGSLSRTHEGTGLGLPLAKHLVELHQGRLSIESEVGKGTVVHIDLPLERVMEAEAPKAANL